MMLLQGFLFFMTFCACTGTLLMASQVLGHAVCVILDRRLERRVDHEFQREVMRMDHTLRGERTKRAVKA